MFTSDHTGLPSETLRSSCRPITATHQSVNSKARSFVWSHLPVRCAQTGLFYLYQTSTFSLSTWIVTIFLLYQEMTLKSIIL